MAIIKPKTKTTKVQQRIKIDATIVAEAEQYCQYAGFENLSDFLEEAASHVFAKDKEFRDWKDKLNPATILP